MEILIFALIASYNAHRRQGRLVAEPEEFRPFDLKELRHFAGNNSQLIVSSCCLCPRIINKDWPVVLPQKQRPLATRVFS
jgi:hypothetical protein